MFEKLFGVYAGIFLSVLPPLRQEDLIHLPARKFIADKKQVSLCHASNYSSKAHGIWAKLSSFNELRSCFCDSWRSWSLGVFGFQSKTARSNLFKAASCTRKIMNWSWKLPVESRIPLIQSLRICQMIRCEATVELQHEIEAQSFDFSLLHFSRLRFIGQAMYCHGRSHARGRNTPKAVFAHSVKFSKRILVPALRWGQKLQIRKNYVQMVFFLDKTKNNFKAFSQNSSSEAKGSNSGKSPTSTSEGKGLSEAPGDKEQPIYSTATKIENKNISSTSRIHIWYFTTCQAGFSFWTTTWGCLTNSLYYSHNEIDIHSKYFKVHSLFLLCIFRQVPNLVAEITFQM